MTHSSNFSTPFSMAKSKFGKCTTLRYTCSNLFTPENIQMRTIEAILCQHPVCLWATGRWHRNKCYHGVDNPHGRSKTETRRMTPLATLTVHDAQTPQNTLSYGTNRLKTQTAINRWWRWRWFWCWVCDILEKKWWPNTGIVGDCWRYTDSSERCWHILTTPVTGDHKLTISAISDRILTAPGNGDLTGKIKSSCVFEVTRHKVIQSNAVPWFAFIQNKQSAHKIHIYIYIYIYI
jgi:hypothetical protein